MTVDEERASFDRLVSEALSQDFSGWDFSWLQGRWHENEPTWGYRQIVQERMVGMHHLLDMGTGGGDVFMPKIIASLSKRASQVSLNGLIGR
jgi:hypothetical protein